ncbi:MAG: aminotransferase class V-fold PLP-dependent enzyme [Bacteroidetes bacterium]|nr:MAG: aminotransferase class V-fold PLP-dependent enzyme [Bacteroidota bacterium]
MPKSIFLTPGPSELYFTVPDHIQTALRESICEISHRSKQFENVVRNTVSQLRTLLNVPEDYYVVFTGSATEIWERSIQNLAMDTTYHFVNGSFSQKFYDFSIALKRHAVKFEVPAGQGFDLENLEIPAVAELICVTENETSSGVTFPLSDIYKLREQYPDKLLIVDAVSIAPYADLDLTKVDSMFFSVQKCFGLPSGLGVWIFNEKCVQKAEALQKEGLAIGTYHSILSLIKDAKNSQTPSTPNMLGIYLLGKVAEDMNRKGVKAIRQEIDYKAALMYDVLSKNKKFELFVKEEKFRSQTVIVANLESESAPLINQIKEQGIVLGGGYGALKARQIRIANFPTHSKETFEKVADLIEKY